MSEISFNSIRDGVTLALHAAGCQVKNIHEHDESLESYYMNLVGGGGDA